MLLAIEQGNTNTLFAVHDGKEWIAQWRTATDSMRTADEYAVWLHQLLEMQHLKLGDLHACIVSSVVPQSIFNSASRSGSKSRPRRAPTGWSTPSGRMSPIPARCW
jgi:pantothenate kinase type III